MRVCVCLRAILISESLDFHSGYSAPGSKIAGRAKIMTSLFFFSFFLFYSNLFAVFIYLNNIIFTTQEIITKLKIYGNDVIVFAGNKNGVVFRWKCRGCREKEGLLVEQTRHFAVNYPIQRAWKAFQKCKLWGENRLGADNSEYGGRKSKLQRTTRAGWGKVEITDTRFSQVLWPQQYFGKWPKRMPNVQGNCRVLWLQA